MNMRHALQSSKPSVQSLSGIGENSQEFELYDVNCYIILHVIILLVAIRHIKGYYSKNHPG